jgi:hypothetical protein
MIITQIAAAIAILLSFNGAFAGEFEILKDHTGSTVSVKDSPFLRMTIGNFNSLSCSHTWVSNDGYLLTALHCIEGCIVGAGEYDGSHYHRFAYKEIEIAGTKYYSHPFTVYEVNESRLKDLRCLLNEGAKGKKPLEARIIAIGAKGWIPDHAREEFKTRYPLLFEKTRQEGYVGIGDYGDFALLKVEPTSETSTIENAFDYFSYPPQCLPIDSGATRLNEQVWSLSFPNVSARPNHKELVFQPVATGGRVFSKTNHPLYSAEDLSNIDEHFLFSSTDSEIGSSGSSLVNSQGKITGLLAMSVSVRDRYTSGSSLFLPASYIIQHFRSTLGDEFVRTKLLNGCVVSSNTETLLSTLRSVSTN